MTSGRGAHGVPALASLVFILAGFPTVQEHRGVHIECCCPALSAMSFHLPRPKPLCALTLQSQVPAPAHRNFLSVNSARFLIPCYRACPLCLDYVNRNRVLQAVACVGIYLFCDTSHHVAQAVPELSLPSGCLGLQVCTSHLDVPFKELS